MTINDINDAFTSEIIEMALYEGVEVHLEFLKEVEKLAMILAASWNAGRSTGACTEKTLT